MQQIKWFSICESHFFVGQMGFGSAAHKAVIRQAMLDGYDFRTHGWSQTDGARKVWERFAQQGVARVDEPFAPDGSGKFNGSYAIEAAK